MKLGGTGKNPRGTFGRELTLTVAQKSDEVIIDFGESVKCIGMAPKDAIEFAKAILKSAGVKKVEITLER